jgi:hypothetical protein
MGELDWEANPGPQKGFLMCPVREVLYGGAKGGGKSEAIGPLVVKHVLTHGEHATVLVLRQDTKQLRDLMRRMRKHCLRANGRYSKSEKTWYFPSGAVILFGHLTDGCDPYWGQEYTMIVIDEVTRCIESETDYIELLGSLRSSHGVPCRVILTSNPGGQGHDWVRARFMGVPPLTIQRDARGLERVFIPASLKNNPKLPEEYRYQLEQLPDAERKAFLEGNWDAFTGQVFDLLPGIHLWSWEQLNAFYGLPKANKAIPKEWNRYRSYDHGFNHPSATYWYAVPPDGRAIVYRELYTVAHDRNGRAIPNQGTKMAPQLVAETIKAYSEGETYAASWSGPDLFAEVRQDQAGGVRIASHFQASGIHFTAWNAAPGSRVAGKQALHARMHYTLDSQGRLDLAPAFIVLDLPDQPGKSSAPHLVRTFAALEYSEVTVELWDKTSEDHAADSVTGFCKMKPWAPKAPKPASPTYRRLDAPSTSRFGA